MALNGTTLLWGAIGSVGGLMITISIFAGNHIISNDKVNTDEHIQIRREFNTKVDGIKDSITDVRIEQMEQKTILRRIEEKL